MSGMGTQIKVGSVVVLSTRTDSSKPHVPPSNYYGTMYVFEREGKCHLGLDDYARNEEVEIGRTLYDALIAEFGATVQREAPPP